MSLLSFSLFLYFIVGYYEFYYGSNYAEFCIRKNPNTIHHYIGSVLSIFGSWVLLPFSPFLILAEILQYNNAWERLSDICWVGMNDLGYSCRIHDTLYGQGNTSEYVQYGRTVHHRGLACTNIITYHCLFLLQWIILFILFQKYLKRIYPPATYKYKL